MIDFVFEKVEKIMEKKKILINFTSIFLFSQNVFKMLISEVPCNFSVVMNREFAQNLNVLVR